MPFYQFTVPAGSPSAGRKAEFAAAFTKVHTEVPGAPARYVNGASTEVPPGSLFVPDSPVERGRMVGIIRAGRSEDVKRELEDGAILPEAADDRDRPS